MVILLARCVLVYIRNTMQQKQLISFARIILKNPSVIIFDEATSLFDIETEELMKKKGLYYRLNIATLQ